MPYAIRQLSILPVSPVCDVGVLRPNSWMDQDETGHAGRPRPWPHCVRWGPSSRPPQKGGTTAPNFRPKSVLAKWLDGTELGLGPGAIVLDGDPTPPKRHTPNFRPMSIAVKRSPISAGAEHLSYKSTGKCSCKYNSEIRARTIVSTIV